MLRAVGDVRYFSGLQVFFNRSHFRKTPLGHTAQFPLSQAPLCSSALILESPGS